MVQTVVTLHARGRANLRIPYGCFRLGQSYGRTSSASLTAATSPSAERGEKCIQSKWRIGGGDDDGKKRMLCTRRLAASLSQPWVRYTACGTSVNTPTIVWTARLDLGVVSIRDAIAARCCEYCSQSAVDLPIRCLRVASMTRSSVVLTYGTCLPYQGPKCHGLTI